MGITSRFKHWFGRSPVQGFARYPVMGNLDNLDFTNFDSENIFQEQIFDSLAKHMSLIDINVFKEFELYDSDITELLTTRPNEYQTPTEFLYTYFYNVYKYQIGIILPHFDSQYKVKSLEVLDMSSYRIGTTTSNGTKYLILDNLNDNDSEPSYIKYSSVILTRNHPISIFTNENFYIPANNIPEIIDNHLATVLLELESNFDIRGIFTLGSVDGLSYTQLGEEEKARKVTDVKDRVSNKLLVLDAGEKFELTNFDFTKQSTDELNNLIDMYYQFYGINKKVISGTWTYEEYSTFVHNTLQPKIKSFQEELNYKLLSKNKRSSGVSINLSLVQLSGISFKEKAIMFKELGFNGTYTDNEVRRKLGDPPYKGGDEHIGNLNQTNMKNLTDKDKSEYDKLKEETLEGGEENET